MVAEIAGPNGIDETQLFVEPMQWMDEVVDGQVQGKLYCPGWVQVLLPHYLQTSHLFSFVNLPNFSPLCCSGS